MGSRRLLTPSVQGLRRTCTCSRVCAARSACACACTHAYVHQYCGPALHCCCDGGPLAGHALHRALHTVLRPSALHQCQSRRGGGLMMAAAAGLLHETARKRRSSSRVTGPLFPHNLLLQSAARYDDDQLVRIAIISSASPKRAGRALPGGCHAVATRSSLQPLIIVIVSRPRAGGRRKWLWPCRWRGSSTS